MNFIQEKKTVLCDQFCTFKKLMNSKTILVLITKEKQTLFN